MTPIEAILLISTGASVALLTADWWTRRHLEAKLTKTDAEMRETLAGVQKINNELARQVLECQDQLSQHEFRLAGRGATSTRSGNAP